MVFKCFQLNTVFNNSLQVMRLTLNPLGLGPLGYSLQKRKRTTPDLLRFVLAKGRKIWQLTLTALKKNSPTEACWPLVRKSRFHASFSWSYRSQVISWLVGTFNILLQRRLYIGQSTMYKRERACRRSWFNGDLDNGGACVIIYLGTPVDLANTPSKSVRLPPWQEY